MRRYTRLDALAARAYPTGVPETSSTPERDSDLAELYDLDCGEFSDDLPFYEQLARATDGPILELGVGTGRVAIALAHAGLEVWGIDTSEAMLERLRCKAEGGDGLHVSQGDMREFDLDHAFALIYAAFGTFHHVLTPENQIACLRCVERHLAPGATFVCDLRPLLDTVWEPGDSAPLLHDWTRLLARTGETVTKLRAVRTDRARQLQHELHIYDRVAADGTVRRTTNEVDLRFTTRFEMEALLHEAGLKLDGMYGDYELSPYNDASELLITVARKPV